MNQYSPLDLLDFIIEYLPVGIMVTDKNGYVYKTNDVHEKITGHPREVLRNTHLSQLVARGNINTSSSLKILNTGLPMILEQTITTPDGQEKEIIVKAIPMCNEEGEVEYVVNYLMDIQEKQFLVNQLKEELFNNEKYRIELKQFRTSENSTSKIIYRSSSMHKLIEKAEQAALTDSTVLITGESGTGKSLLAKHIHHYSHRRDNTFFSLNCGAIPANLIESELFGYEKGSFSGANNTGKKGVFEYAAGGTLFLDEIGEMPYDLQVKLLSVLQENEFYRIGGTTPIKTDVRIIAATNADLKEKISANRFRLDLFYRLNVISFTIPPLRERPEDIPVMVEHAVKKINRKYGSEKNFGPEAIQRLMKLPLYGNVRELENIVERNMLFSLHDTIIDLEMVESIESPHYAPSLQGNSGERQALLEAIKLYKTTSEIAKQFGVNQSTISRRLKKHGINIKAMR